jgi:hypothetical protein
MKRLAHVLPGLVTATATALVVAILAHTYVGLTLDTIRTDALGSAGIIFAAFTFWSSLKQKK